MSAEGSLAVRYYGTDEAVDAPTRLRAGPLTVEFEAGNLRYARISGVEAMRGIAFIVRDRNWGTYAPAITNLEIDQRRGGFTVSYDACCKDAEQELRYSARITGDADGTLRFELQGRTYRVAVDQQWPETSRDVTGQAAVWLQSVLTRARGSARERELAVAAVLVTPDAVPPGGASVGLLFLEAARQVKCSGCAFSFPDRGDARYRHGSDQQPGALLLIQSTD